MRSLEDLARATAVACFVALSVASPVAGQSVGSSTDAAVVVSRIQIDNFGRVGPSYYRGAQPKGRDYEDLAALGVKTIINLTDDDSDSSETAMAERAGLRHVQIPMTTHRPPTAAQLADFLRIVNGPESQPVFVHCVGGRHRTGVMTAVYRMTTEGWTADQAFKEMKLYHFGPDFLHPEFKAFVYQYQPAALPLPAAAAATLPAIAR